MTTPQPLLYAPPVAARDRLRLVLLVIMLVLWVVPTWSTSATGDTYTPRTGALSTGAAAAIALLVLFGLAATSLLARHVRELRIGMAFTHALAAGVVVVLLHAEHPWIPGGALRGAWLPIFLPLALLALLDAWRTWADESHGTALAIARAVAGLFAAGALYVGEAYLPAGLAAWLGISGLVSIRAERPREARRSLEFFVVLAALAAGAAPQIHARVVGLERTLHGTLLGAAGYAWVVLCAIVATTGVDGLVRPLPEDDAAPAA